MILRTGLGGYADLAIPVSGPKGTGHLYAVASQRSNGWVFSRLVVWLDEGRERVDLSDPVIRDPFQSSGSAAIYLVPLGKPSAWSPDELRDYVRQKLGIEVQVLPCVALDASVEDAGRHQAVADRLIDLMKKSEPRLAEDPHAILVGITERDMYIRGFGWRYAYNLRQGGRWAVLSTARFRGNILYGGDNPEAVEVRLRKTLTKNIALLYYHLPESLDPTSVAYQLNPMRPFPLSIIDGMGEDLIGRYGVWLAAWQEGDPCVTVIQPPIAPPTWNHDCGHFPPRDSMSQSFETDLRLSLFVQAQTDFYFDEELPLWLVRMYRPADRWSRAFGVGTNHSLDVFLVGDSDRFAWLDLIQEDGSRIHFRRVSWGSGYANAVLEATGNSDSPFSASTIRWNGHGWDLTRPDGWIFVFPASREAQRSQQAALVGIHDHRGRVFTFERNRRGNLLHVRTPAGNTLDFTYDSADRVTLARAGNGRWVRYTYDTAGRLVRVDDASARAAQYGYDAQNRMLTAEDGTGRTLIRNQYDPAGCLVRQTLVDGQVLTYSCAKGSDGSLRATTFTDPHGVLLRFSYDEDMYRQSLPEVPPHSGAADLEPALSTAQSHRRSP